MKSSSYWCVGSLQKISNVSNDDISSIIHININSVTNTNGSTERDGGTKTTTKIAIPTVLCKGKKPDLKENMIREILKKNRCYEAKYNSSQWQRKEPNYP